MEELNFDEMRDQITLLKQKLDRQSVKPCVARWEPSTGRNINLISVLLYVLYSIL